MTPDEDPRTDMFRYKHQYTESRSEAPADYTLPAVAAPGHNKTNIRLVHSIQGLEVQLPS